MAVYMATDGWTCGVCSRQLSSRQGLQKHEILHTRERPFACTLCNEWFRLKVDRDHHHLKHRVMCKICGVMFIERFNLKKHMTNIHGLLAGVKRRYIKPKQGLAASDHDDNNEASPAGQGRDDDPPGSEHQTEPKSKRRHRAAPAEDEIADWTTTGQGGDDVRYRQSPRSEHRVAQTKPKSRRCVAPIEKSKPIWRLETRRQTEQPTTHVDAAAVHGEAGGHYRRYRV
jgi:hypothetical protein